jgi:glycerol uptake facilitator-like aquaporin
MEVLLNPGVSNNEVGCKTSTPVERMRRYMESLPELPPAKKEIQTRRFWRSLFAEFLSTMLLVTFTYDEPGSSGDDVKMALTFGLAVATLTRCFDERELVHTNPAVTIALASTRRISVLRTGFYCSCQILASIVGGTVARALGPVPGPLAMSITIKANELKEHGSSDVNFSRTSGNNGSSSLGSNHDVDVQWITIFGLEFLGTLVVVITSMKSMREPCAAYIGMSYSLGTLLTVSIHVPTPVSILSCINKRFSLPL